jgi:hypothetical protein
MTISNNDDLGKLKRINSWGDVIGKMFCDIHLNNKITFIFNDSFAEVSGTDGEGVVYDDSYRPDKGQLLEEYRLADGPRCKRIERVTIIEMTTMEAAEKEIRSYHYTIRLHDGGEIWLSNKKGPQIPLTLA